MPPSLLMDLGAIDLDHVVLDKAQIYELLPHGHEFALLNAVCYHSPERNIVVGYRDLKLDDWWVRGHVPGRPLLPGVLMLEMGAQLSALCVKLIGGQESFIAFGGVDKCKFRESVTPPTRIHMIAVGREIRPRRIVSDVQGIIDGTLIFEAEITGMPLR